MAQQYSYRPNMNRNVTRKWAEARKVDYENDGWGDDDDDDDDDDNQPVNPLSQERRSFTNPPALNTHRLSFDRGRGTEQRVFSAGAAQPPHDLAYPQRFYGPPAHESPAPVGRASGDSQRRDGRPDSRGSNKQLPPRKQSLGQSDMPSLPTVPLGEQEPVPALKPLPFIRPVDIYKRHAEEERRSQESSRPSTDSGRRDEPTTSPPVEEPLSKRQQTLDTVAERPAEHLDPSAATSTVVLPGVHQIHTGVDRNRSIASASSTYTDRPDPVSASSGFPSRNVSLNQPASEVPSRNVSLNQPASEVPSRNVSLNQPASEVPSRNVSLNQPASEVPSRNVSDTTPPLQHLPQISRTSTFGVDMFSTGASEDPQPVQQPPPVPEKDNQNLNHQPSFGYRTMVKDAFHLENQLPGSPATTNDSLGRSNTTSTSEISPIVSKAKQPPWDRGLSDIAERANENDAAAEYTPPRRLGTNRKDSPSPARRPHSVEAPPVLEPQSAITISESPFSGEALEAQMTRPGPALLVDQPKRSAESLAQLAQPPEKKDSKDSAVSNESNQRSASEEWAHWSAAKEAAHARHGISDSNPTTPGVESSGQNTPAPFDSLDKNVHIPSSSDEPARPRGIAGLPSQRPQMARDESFRPVLPGGWLSSQSIERSTPEPPRPPWTSADTRMDSAESIPTAKAPPSADWKSAHTTDVQGQAFANASAAGAALAGIFSGPALTSSRSHSEVSSIDEQGGAATRPDVAHRDFADPNPEPPVMPQESATKDFAELVPKTTLAQPSKPAPMMTGQPGFRKTTADSVGTDSPTKDSEHWWSDGEEMPPAPAPLRTSRMSTSDSKPSVSSIARRTNNDGRDADQLESDIVKSLTPKSSRLAEAPTETDGPSSERKESLRSTSTPVAAAPLVMSPAQDINMMEKQRDWKPPTVSPSNARSSDMENPPPVHQTNSKPASAPDVPAGSANVRPVQTPLTTTNISNTDDVPLSARSPAKEFAIFGDVPPLAPFTLTGATATEALKDSPTSTHYPAKATANEVTTVPTVGSERSLPPEQAAAKDGPKPLVTAANDTARPTTPKVSGPVSPITPQAAKMPVDYNSNRPFPAAKVPLEQIFNMASPQQRIQAYNDNREAFVQPVGHLENWLAFMKTCGHDDVFTATPIASTPYLPSPKHSHKESTGTPSGANQMREDGRRLVAAASKYGAKAGVLGKDLFSKGKEKIRNVSSGQKGSSSRSKTASTPDVDKTSSASGSVAPQIPTPAMATPIDETSLSTYFSRDNPRAAAEPPFSPISEVSSHPRTSGPVVGVTVQETLPQSGSMAHPDPTATPTRQDTNKSTGAVSAIEGEVDNRTPALLNPTHDNRRNSSVSDVSSISEHDRQRQASPPDLQSSMGTATQPVEEHAVKVEENGPHPHHVPNYATTVATAPTAPLTKESEALEDRQQDESTLPAYQAPRPPRIAPDTQIVPIARIRQDETPPRTEQPRPFSFAGSESNVDYGTNRSLDMAVAIADAHAAHQQNPEPNWARSREHAESPLPSARRNPEEFARKPQTAEEFARLRAQAPVGRAQPDEDEDYRIPGPYGHELRSPRNRTSNPMLQQVLRPTPLSQHPEGDPTAPSGNAFAAVEAARRQYEHAQPHGQPARGDAFDSTDHAHPHPQHMHSSETQPYQDRTENYLPYAQTFRPMQPHVPEQDRPRERGRSKISSLFGRSRSKSGSRRLKKEQSEAQRERTNVQGREADRPDSGRRNSLFKLGSRSSVSTPAGASAQAPQSGHEAYDEISGQYTPQPTGPGAATRKQSKDLFKQTTLSHMGYSQQQSPASQQASGKKKRFSGLFGKSSKDKETDSQLPARARTLPLNAQGPYVQPSKTFHGQATIPEDGQPGLGPNDFQREAFRAEQQHSMYRQQSPPIQGFQGRQPPAQGYFGQPDEEQTFHSGYGPQHPADRSSWYSNTTAHRPYAAGIYQHENRPYQYGTDVVESGLGGYSSPQAPAAFATPQRPDLPRINTGERNQPSSGGMTVSAPAVSGSYLQARQNTTGSTSTSTQPIQSFKHSPSAPLSQDQQAYQPPSTRTQRDISYGSDIHERRTGTPASSGPSQTQAQRFGQSGTEQSRITPRVAALHTRSRSPKLGRRSSEDLDEAYHALSGSARSPVDNLGTFMARTGKSPVGGVGLEEQEKPWTLNLPGESDNQAAESNADPASATSSRAREMRRIMLERSPIEQPVTQELSRPQTVAEKFIGVPTSASAASAPTTAENSAGAGMKRFSGSIGDGSGSVKSGATAGASTPSITPSAMGSQQGSVRKDIPVQNEVERFSSLKRKNAPTSTLASGVSRDPSKPQRPPQTAVTRAAPPPPVPITMPPPIPTVASASRPTNEGGMTTALAAPVTTTKLSTPDTNSTPLPLPPTTTTEPVKALPTGSRNAKAGDIHEMPGSRPEGYESDEEPVMSATAYPGQEWQPVFDRWED